MDMDTDLFHPCVFAFLAISNSILKYYFYTILMCLAQIIIDFALERLTPFVDTKNSQLRI